jgi:hypothetical protein
MGTAPVSDDLHTIGNIGESAHLMPRFCYGRHKRRRSGPAAADLFQLMCRGGGLQEEKSVIWRNTGTGRVLYRALSMKRQTPEPPAALAWT